MVCCCDAKEQLTMREGEGGAVRLKARADLVGRLRDGAL